MAKVGKLRKLKSVIKRWPSLTKLSRSSSSAAIAAADSEAKEDVHAVYVGKTRRRYLVGADVVFHPLFQELVDRSGGYDEDGKVVVSCEVVLFEHLLWMLENDGAPLGSTEELAEFYTC